MLYLSCRVPAASDGLRLDAFLRRQGLSAGLIRAVKHTAAAFLPTACPSTPTCPVRAGRRLWFALPPEPPTSVAPQPVDFGIRFEDGFAAVLDKPAGLAVHPTLNYPDATLANGWLWHLRQQGRDGVFRPVNRIDKNTKRPGAVRRQCLCRASAGRLGAQMLPGRCPRRAAGAGGRHRRAHRPAGRFHHRPHGGARRQAQRHPLPGAGPGRRLYAGGLPARHRPHPPDPRPLCPFGLPAGGGTPFTAGRPQTSGGTRCTAVRSASGIRWTARCTGCKAPCRTTWPRCASAAASTRRRPTCLPGWDALAPVPPCPEGFVPFSAAQHPPAPGEI